MVSLCLVNLFRGAILYPFGLYISYVVGSVNLCGIVGSRGLCSKIVPEKEIGTLMGALSVFYATSPVAASLLYTQTYRLSADTMPGLAFLFGSLAMFISILAAVYLHIKYNKFKSRLVNRT